MKAVLVRVGIDHSYGVWNAPVNADNDYVYVPIPESRAAVFRPEHERRYDEVHASIAAFCGRCPPGVRALGLPAALRGKAMHLDPDFAHLTYGDHGRRRGRFIASMTGGDLIAFYAGLRPVHDCGHRLIYALVGVYVVDEVVAAASVTPDRWRENAHTRRSNHGAHDIVVRARPGVSGRFERCVPIGHYRANAYRVRPDVLAAWGGLGVRDGYIQRSGVPPRLLDPRRFAAWLAGQSVRLRADNG